MKRFKKILVGVDLSQGDHLVSDQLPEPTSEAIRRGVWLAQTSGAELTYFSSIAISARAQHLIEESPDSHDDVMHVARDILEQLAAQAADAGVRVAVDVACGEPSHEIVQRVSRDGHDLVIIGTRHHSRVERALFGTTGNGLLRRCPCPVWITRPKDAERIESVLVAHCLRGVGDLAMELGCSMAELHHAQLHALHSTQTPEANGDKAEAERRIREQLQGYEFDKTPEIHVVDAPPHDAIMEAIRQYEVELLVMGTVARSGVAGMLVGNTAEKLLPEVTCSLLAVKPG